MIRVECSYAHLHNACVVCVGEDDEDDEDGDDDEEEEDEDDDSNNDALYVVIWHDSHVSVFTQPVVLVLFCICLYFCSVGPFFGSFWFCGYLLILFYFLFENKQKLSRLNKPNEGISPEFA